MVTKFERFDILETKKYTLKLNVFKGRSIHKGSFFNYVDKTR